MSAVDPTGTFRVLPETLAAPAEKAERKPARKFRDVPGPWLLTTLPVLGLVVLVVWICDLWPRPKGTKRHYL